MVAQTENIFEIYEAGSFTKSDRRGPDINIFDDITKSYFGTSFFKSNEVKPYLRSTQYLEKLNVLHVNIRSIKRNFENFKALLEECELVFSIMSQKHGVQTPNCKTI